MRQVGTRILELLTEKEGLGVPVQVGEEGEVSEMLKAIKTEGLKALMDGEKKVVVVDVLSSEAYSKEHICGSISIPLGDVDLFAPELLEKDDSVVLYCAGLACTASETAGVKFEKLGFTDVKRYEEGIEGWKEAGYCLEGSGLTGSALAEEAHKAAI